MIPYPNRNKAISQILRTRSLYTARTRPPVPKLFADLRVVPLRFKDTPPAAQCQVCNGDHPTYQCCDRCDYDTHTCGGCGDPVTHAQGSDCGRCT